MAKGHTIKITIDKMGKTKIEVDGVKGASCEELTKGIEKALGSVSSRKQTDEYFEQEVEENNVRQY